MKNLLVKMATFNHNKITAKRRDWAGKMMKGQGKPENPVAAIAFEWVKATLELSEAREEAK